MKTSSGIRRAGATTAVVLALSGCAAGDGGVGASSSPAPSSQAPHSSAGASGHGHAADGGPAPEGIRQAPDPRFPTGTDVILEADHMPGMMNASASIAGAFDTTAYAVDYSPTTGGPAVEDHQWVVQEELRGTGEQPLDVGDTAVMTAEHMPGMKGATATVSQVWTGTVYMVDYESGGMTMTNHKWIIEDEIRPVQ